MSACCAGHSHHLSLALQEVEKEIWDKDAGGKRKLRLVQETGYKYEEDMEGACCLLCRQYLASEKS